MKVGERTELEKLRNIKSGQEDKGAGTPLKESGTQTWRAGWEPRPPLLDSNSEKGFLGFISSGTNEGCFFFLIRKDHPVFRHFHRCNFKKSPLFKCAFLTFLFLMDPNRHTLELCMIPETSD